MTTGQRKILDTRRGTGNWAAISRIRTTEKEIGLNCRFVSIRRRIRSGNRSAAEGFSRCLRAGRPSPGRDRTGCPPQSDLGEPLRLGPRCSSRSISHCPTASPTPTSRTRTTERRVRARCCSWTPSARAAHGGGRAARRHHARHGGVPRGRPRNAPGSSHRKIVRFRRRRNKTRFIRCLRLRGTGLHPVRFASPQQPAGFEKAFPRDRRGA